jgi:hypothetical protein
MPDVFRNLTTSSLLTAELVASCNSASADQSDYLGGLFTRIKRQQGTGKETPIFKDLQYF